MTIVHKLVNSLVSRLQLGRRDDRSLLETVLRQLPCAAYWRLQEQGFCPGSIIDVGAHEGHWSRTIRSIFPSPPILMIEARREQEPILKRISSELLNVQYTIELLGSKNRKAVQFHVNDTGSSIYAERSNMPKAQRTMASFTLDDVTARFDWLTPPIFLKLDVQGAELDCLRGGAFVLARSEVVQLEVALLNYNEGAPQAAEVIKYMDEQGFSIFDIAGFVRPNGVNLVQIDLLFVSRDLKLRPDYFYF